MKNEKLKLVYQRIRDLRIKKGFSQQHVADVLSISQNAYYKIENGKTNLHLGMLLSLTEVFEVPLCDFLVDLKNN